MTLSFGTDGVRGRAYEDIRVDDVEHLASVAADVLGSRAMVVGTDTRESGPDFVDAVCRGASRSGVTPWLLGDAPTPAVARAAATEGVAGAMVSASHNPFHDNGIKFFAPGGRKLTDDQQHAIEQRLGASAATVGQPGADPIARPDLVEAYADWVAGTIQGRTLSGLRVVVDCANGAASAVAPGVLAGLGADVTAINDQPNGRNINADCGSTHLAGLSAHVTEVGADLGLAFDGDADRILAVDRDGQHVDGDQIIAVCALDLRSRGMLRDDTVVVTVMTNLGFRHGMAAASVEVHETPVGDRHVLEALEANSWSLGGEQSGHVIFADLATTGDGLLTAVQLLDVLARGDADIATLADQAMRRLPQRLRNARVEGAAADELARVSDTVAAVEADLGTSGRLLVRPSGTEPVIRVMAEAPDQATADHAVDRVIAALEAPA